MANNVQRTNLAANTGLDAETALLNSGKLKIYSGTQPATGDTALSGNTLLATLTFNATAFGAASGAIATANAITSETNAPNTGTATFARLFKSDGTTAVMDCSVGTSGADITLPTVSITAGDTVAISSFTLTARKNPC